MSEVNSHNLDGSSTQEVIIAENIPIIESGSQSGMFNRLRKFSERVRQNQWISQFDLFSTPLKLNYKGEDCYKTEFGGLVYLTIGLFSVIFSMMYQFPNGLELKSPITFYSLRKDTGNDITVFDYTDTFFEIYLYNVVEKHRANATEVNFLLKNVSIMQIINNQPQKLTASKDCQIGDICFKKIPGNQNAYIFGSNGAPNSASIQMEIASCGFFDMDPVLGMCIGITTNYVIVVEVASYIQQTGSVQKTSQKFIFSLGAISVATLDTSVYTTNNNFLGFIANIFSYTLSYYVPIPQSFPADLKTYDNSLDCIDFNTYMGTNVCTIAALISSGTTNLVTQNFDDITAPLLFFMSISQTLFYFCYIFFLRNYSNNALHLRIADSVVYIPDGQGRHHNFKSGVAVFLGCLIYKHFLIKILDQVLYLTIQRQIKKLLPIKAQLTMEMIAYGESCLGQQQFFSRINSVYEQENLQPTKIVFEDQEEDQSKKKEESSQKDSESGQTEDSQYFEDQISLEAFKRMCEEHEYYSPERKAHLCNLLKRSDKNYKLVLMIQEQFEQYRRQVKLELGGKQQTCPINFNNVEASGLSLYRSKP